MKGLHNLFSFKILLVVLFVGVCGVAGYFFWQYQQLKKNPNLMSQQEVKEITNKIGEFLELPTDEQPTLATVTDQEKLKDQLFFKKAQNGDKILIYTNAKKAILYRPKTNKIIEVAPLILGESTEKETSSEEQSKTSSPITVAIYNGTSTSGLANDVEKKILSVPNTKVVDKSNAAKNNYKRTTVVDLTGTNDAIVSQIASALGAEKTKDLPDGETKPEAMILVIAGKEK